MASADFKKLRARLSYLATTLPPDPLVPGSFTPAEVDAIASYAVMSSAACEHYIEERCTYVAEHALSRFETHKKIGRVGKHLCILPFLQIPKDTTDNTALKAILGDAGFGIQMSRGFRVSATNEIEKILQRGTKMYLKAIRDNHGIAYKFHFKLLATIGIDIKRFSPTFESSIDKLWRLRGKAAHRMVVAATVVYPTVDMHHWTAELTNGFESLDVDFKNLMQKSS